MSTPPQIYMFTSTGSTVWVISGSWRSEACFCDKHISVLLEFPSRDKGFQVIQRWNKQTNKQQNCMTVAAPGGGLGAFLLYSWFQSVRNLQRIEQWALVPLKCHCSCLWAQTDCSFFLPNLCLGSNMSFEIRQTKPLVKGVGGEERGNILVTSHCQDTN